MLIKASTLTGPALDWAVSKCEGLEVLILIDPIEVSLTTVQDHLKYGGWVFKPSTNWAQGGPIIDREFITVGPYHGTDGKAKGVFQAYIGWDKELLDPLFQSDGPTPLIAAMRCYVSSCLGETIDVPDEICG